MRAPVPTFHRARALRRELTLPEVLLWQALRRNALNGLRFRRQHPIGPYILDFYCAPARLAVEIDGAAHDHPKQARHDLRRDAWLAARAIRVLRIPAADVLSEERRDRLLLTISSLVAPSAPSTACGGTPPPPGGGGSAPLPGGGGGPCVSTGGVL